MFVDMLGFSALTRGRLTLTEREYQPWKVPVDGNYPNQLLAAQILLAFRKVLTRTQRHYYAVKLAQLSDCAFLWSKDAASLVQAGRYLMHEAVKAGLLCRGGLAYGDIHEPNKINHSIGAFIVGDAVTRAASYETQGKGMRIFTDADTAHALLQKQRYESFHGLKNPLTGDIVDEWQWYSPQLNFAPSAQKPRLEGAISDLVSCHTMLRFSPRFAWNATSSEGCRQLACSIESVSQVMQKLSCGKGDYGFSAEYLMHSMHIRSDTVQKRFHAQYVNELLQWTSSGRKPK
ncbi:hypothetical protein PPUJ20005_38340 [Pseudomonas putida]|nr:hypothetical protein PPUJ20005_38340 [Pseudomonas putida]